MKCVFHIITYFIEQYASYRLFYIVFVNLFTLSFVHIFIFIVGHKSIDLKIVIVNDNFLGSLCLIDIFIIIGLHMNQNWNL